MFSTSDEEVQLKKQNQQRAEIVKIMERLTAEKASKIMYLENYKALFTQVSQHYVRRMIS